MNTHPLKPTLGDPEWMKANASMLRDLLPTTWTHISNLNGLQLGMGLKCAGVDWRSENDFVNIMLFLGKTGIMQRDGVLVRGNPNI